ncbi:hypothetical protein K0M31_001956 [Melipona bicolor]|uniref:Uncharacterized protein n=1 Tax=Melipona bicolor TaxID=60889 RepID=A0AA40GGL7_9HYME|nr:hypothetical protein K0M31_001956 [Melipona bicolor]
MVQWTPSPLFSPCARDSPRKGEPRLPLCIPRPRIPRQFQNWFKFLAIRLIFATVKLLTRA